MSISKENPNKTRTKQGEQKTMKSKFMKKLVLNKETIANLGNNMMGRLRGGQVAVVEPQSEFDCKSEAYVSACMGKYTCLNSYCPVYTCTCEPEPTTDPIVTQPIDVDPIGVPKF